MYDVGGGDDDDVEDDDNDDDDDSDSDEGDGSGGNKDDYLGKAQEAQAFQHSFKGPHVRTYIFSSLAKRFLAFFLVATSCLG